MYNYYMDEKRKKEKMKKERMKKDEEIFRENRKKEIKRLSSGYENRLKNFIYDMAHEPIIIHDRENQIETTRKQLFDEEADKIRDRHGFILKGFKTEKQRIEEYLNEKKYGYLGNNKRAEEIMDLLDKFYEESPENFSDDNNSNLLVQPSMRFKPRSDLERIFDINNDYNYGRVDRKIIDKHLSALGLFSEKRVNSDEEEIKENEEKAKITENEKLKKRRDKIIKDRKEANEIRQNRYRLDQVPLKNLLINSKSIMGDLHHKTFFKGAANFTVLSETKRTVKKKLSTINNEKLVLNKTHSPEKTNLFSYRPINSEIKNDIANMNPLLYELNSNPYRKIRDNEVDVDALKKVKELAFKDHDSIHSSKKKLLEKIKNGILVLDNYPKDLMEDPSIKINQLNYFKKYSDNTDFTAKKAEDDKIKIGNKEFNREDITSISKIILTKCHYFHKKNKNNNTSLMSGNGKLMQTNGLTINEFLNKYNVTTTCSSIK